MKIEKNSVVTMDYTLSDPNGEVIDSSKEAGPFAYLHGHNNIIPGLEKELEGRGAGESIKVIVNPLEGYGEIDERLVTKVTKSQFPQSDNLEVGQRFQAAGPDGESQIFQITSIDGDDITIDGNHPLAGIELHFQVDIKEIRSANPEELAHGHVHGAGGHHH